MMIVAAMREVVSAATKYPRQLFAESFQKWRVYNVCNHLAWKVCTLQANETWKLHWVNWASEVSILESRFRYNCVYTVGSIVRTQKNLLRPRKRSEDGEIALWSATNRWYVVKHVSQKRNQSNDKTRWYNILVTCTREFNSGRYYTKIWLLSNLSNCKFTLGKIKNRK